MTQFKAGERALAKVPGQRPFYVTLAEDTRSDYLVVLVKVGQSIESKMIHLADLHKIEK